MEPILRMKRAVAGVPRWLKLGVPFLVFMIGGSIGLKEFAQLRYDVRKGRQVDTEELEKYSVKKDPSEMTLDAVYHNEVKHLDFDSWENIRGPRAWEEGSEQIIENMVKKAAVEREKRAKVEMERIRNS